MKCNKADELIMKYMDGILSMEEAQKLNEHIKVCDSCREEFFTYQIMMEEFQGGKIVEAPEEFQSDIMKKIQDINVEYKPKENVSIENITAMLWGAFSLLFGIGVLLFIYRQSVLGYLLQNPYIGEWVQGMIPTVDVLSAYADGIKNDIETILSNGEQIIVSLRMVLAPILIVLGSIQYYLYRKRKVEI